MNIVKTLTSAAAITLTLALTSCAFAPASPLPQGKTLELSQQIPDVLEINLEDVYVFKTDNQPTVITNIDIENTEVAQYLKGYSESENAEIYLHFFPYLKGRQK